MQSKAEIRSVATIRRSSPTAYTSRTLPLATRSTPGRSVEVRTVGTASVLLVAAFGVGDEMAVVPAPSEVNRQTDGEPHDETNPGSAVERGHHGKADQDAQNRYDGNPRCAVRPRRVGVRLAHDHDADAHNHECKQRPDAGHVPETGERNKTGEHADEDH